jgi:hypothetical protein
MNDTNASAAVSTKSSGATLGQGSSRTGEVSATSILATGQTK